MAYPWWVIKYYKPSYISPVIKQLWKMYWLIEMYFAFMYYIWIRYAFSFALWLGVQFRRHHYIILGWNHVLLNNSLIKYHESHTGLLNKNLTYTVSSTFIPTVLCSTALQCRNCCNHFLQRKETIYFTPSNQSLVANYHFFLFRFQIKIMHVRENKTPIFLCFVEDTFKNFSHEKCFVVPFITLF